SEFLLRAAKASVVPWHWHTANEAITVVKGTFTVECEGKKFDLGPGSFTYTPSRLIHRATFSEGSLIALSADGPFDLSWGGGPLTGRKSGEATPVPAAFEPGRIEIEGVPMEAVEVARGGRPGEAPGPGKKVTDPVAVKRLLGALESGRSGQGGAL